MWSFAGENARFAGIAAGFCRSAADVAGILPLVAEATTNY